MTLLTASRLRRTECLDGETRKGVENRVAFPRRFGNLESQRRCCRARSSELTRKVFAQMTAASEEHRDDPDAFDAARRQLLRCLRQIGRPVLEKGERDRTCEASRNLVAQSMERVGPS